MPHTARKKRKRRGMKLELPIDPIVQREIMKRLVFGLFGNAYARSALLWPAFVGALAELKKEREQNETESCKENAKNDTKEH